MKLLQLRYLTEIVSRGLSISEAAIALHTSQSGVSRQVQLLEQELALQIFQRKGKRLTGLTVPGETIVAHAQKVLLALDDLKRAGEELSHQDRGTLTIATTHTQARYFLPVPVRQFTATWPNVALSIHQSNPTQVAEQVARGEADLGIASEALTGNPALLCLPCYEWNRCIIMPKRHPLLKAGPLTLRKLAGFPLITYDFAFTGASLVSKVFADAGLTPNIVLTAIDADVIKTYVKLGLGIGLIATMAYDAKADSELAMLDASHLFPPTTTYLGLRRGSFMREYFYDFIHLLVPEQSRKSLLKALSQP
jgi:LysR family transcriptional regulator, cys regulon transcriptional activator